MSKYLIVLTDKYPYGSGETFIEAERPFWKYFDAVYICPVLVRQKDSVRPGFKRNKYERVITTIDKKPILPDIPYGLDGAITLGQIFREIRNNIGSKNKIKSAFSTAIYSNLRYKRLSKKLQKSIIDLNGHDILIYSYWMFEPALVGIGLKKQIKRSRLITRAHGYDLYEERQPDCYTPYRELVLKSVDAIYPISENGRMYLSERYKKKYDAKIFVKRLGTVRLYKNQQPSKNLKKITLVSCSNMVPLKRIDRIIETLFLMKEDIYWYHFGDGELRNSLSRKAKELPGNITVCFKGRVPNREVQRFYSEHYIDAFVNVSDTEGIPVSIMEAQSYGIPVIATDVGGTSELVHNMKNGVLLRKDFSNTELQNAIYIVLDNNRLFKEQSLKIWNEMSNADNNYSLFFQSESKKL